jgi:hypothetical protein
MLIASQWCAHLHGETDFGAIEMEAVWLEWVVHQKWSVAKRVH